MLPLAAPVSAPRSGLWPLPLPLLGLLLAVITWLGCGWLARSWGRPTLGGRLLLRSRLSLAVPLALAGVLLGLQRLVPEAFLPLPDAADLRALLGALALAWSLLRCRAPLLEGLDHLAPLQPLAERERVALRDLLDKLITLLVVVLLGTPLLRLLGVTAGVLLTAGGFGAAALAFGARTIVENGLSGVGLYLSRLFVVGDVIRLPALQLQGEVEAIGWFHTRLRDPQRQTLVVPNGLFTTQAVQNLSQLDHRRVEFEVLLRHSDRPQLAAITRDLNARLTADAAVDTTLPARAHLVGISEPGLRLALLCHAASSDLAEALALQQRLLLELAEVVDHHGAAFASFNSEVSPRFTPPGCGNG